MTALRANPLGDVTGRAEPLAALTLGLLAVCLLFGGGARRGLPSDVLPQIASLPVLLGLLWRRQESLARHRLPLILLGAILLLPLLHLIPLPPELWSRLPGRGPFLETYTAVGMAAPWQPLSMRPSETLRSFLSLLPPAAIFLATLCLDGPARRQMLRLMLAVGILSIFIGMLQLIGGKGSDLYFYAITNDDRAVGLFANANHYAAMLYVLLPLAAALFVGGAETRTTRSLVVLAVVWVMLVLGLSMTGSRTALVLGGLSLLATYFLILRKTLDALSLRSAGWPIAALTAMIVLPLASGLGLFTIVDRLDAEVVAGDARWAILASSRAALEAYAPLGSGIGSFERAYQLVELPGTLMHFIVNHVHNDWIEIAIEGGVPAAALAASLLVWLAVASVRALKAGDPLARAACVVVGLLLIHSLWDYPLRTAAISAIFAFCCAVLGSPPEEDAAIATMTRLRSLARQGRYPAS